MSPLSHASNQLAWFTGSTENSNLLKRSIVRFRRRARNVSSFVSVYSLIWNLALVFLLIPGAAAFLNEVYPNRISTSQIRLGFSSWARRRGPRCASDRHIGGGCPGFSAWYPAPRVHDIYIQLCPGDTVEARPVCFFHDMLWSRVSSSGLLALEEVVSGTDICNVLPRFFNLKYKTNWRKRLTHSVTFAVALTEPTWIWTTILKESDRNRISFSCHMRLDFLFFPCIFPV